MNILLVLYAVFLMISSVFILVGYFLGPTLSSKVEERCQDFTDTGYRVKNADGEAVGLLLGTAHLSLNPCESAQMTQFIQNSVDENGGVVLTEIEPEFIGLGPDACAKNVNGLKSHFEPLIVQRAFLNRSIIVGEIIIHLPVSYKFLTMFPLEFVMVFKAIMAHVKSFNMLYDRFTDNAYTQFLINRRKKAADNSVIFKRYMENDVFMLSEEDRYILCMAERDAHYVNTLLNQDNHWVALVGASHLSGKHGICAQLKAQGYQFEGFSVYQEGIASKEGAEGA